MEILVKICSYFCSHCSSYGTLHHSSEDNQCLVSLCRTSRTLRVAAEDVLRHACILDHHTLDSISMHKDEQRLAKFIWKICQDDEAASSVKTISLLRPIDTYYWFDEEYIMRLRLQLPLPTYWKNYKGFCAMQRAMLDKHGISMQLGQSASQIVAALTHAAPNLESLRFVVCSGLDLAQSWVNARPLSRLKSLELIPKGGPFQEPISRMEFNLTARLFELTPNLKTLRLAGFEILCRQTPPCFYPQLCAHEAECSLLPRTLSSIVMSKVKSGQLVHLFDDCPNLIDIEILIEYPFLTCVAELEELPSQFEPAFTGRRESLQRLVVSVEDLFMSWKSQEKAEEKEKEFLADKDHCDSLSYQAINMHFGGMTALKHLALDHYLLFSELRRYSTAACERSDCEWTAVAAVLPASLETLCVGVLVSWVHMHAFLAALYDARLRGELIHLRTVKLISHYGASSTMIQKIDLLGKMLKHMGVQVVIGREPDVPYSLVGKRRHLLSASLHESFNRESYNRKSDYRINYPFLS